MYTPVKFICLSTLLVSTLVLPQKLENRFITEHQFDSSPQLLLAKERETDSKGCTSSPSPGCSRRDLQPPIAPINPVDGALKLA
ncbi:hypothetical protein [Microcoleus sp. herbarium12]|jgi:hypothetical protein|uniref:hypothetical protein n=1 Tax=Microcoleus sp. herbarium12 TaxID=3055437 RepID=UPI002FD479C1